MGISCSRTNAESISDAVHWSKALLVRQLIIIYIWERAIALIIQRFQFLILPGYFVFRIFAHRLFMVATWLLHRRPLHRGVTGRVLDLRRVLVIEAAHIEIACLPLAEQIDHIRHIDVLVTVIQCARWLLAIDVYLRVDIRRRILTNVDVRIGHKQFHRALLHLRRLLVDVLDIHQVLGDILAVLKVLLVQLRVVLRRLERCLLIRELIR